MKNFYKALILVFILMLFMFASVSAQNMTVQITAPSDNSQFEIGSDITVTVATSIQTGTIATLQLYFNGFLLANLNPSTPEYNWTNIPNGVYVLSAKAWDNGGNTVTSDSITINVGNTEANDRLVNGEFNIAQWPWRFDNYEGAVAKFEIYPAAGLTEDTSAAYITFTQVGNYFWGVQLMQSFKLQKGHTYTVSFVAWATEEKPIQITFSMDYSPWAAHWWTDINLQPQPQSYGPYSFVCDFDDPLVMFKFVIGGNLIPMFLDAVKVLDTETPAAVEPLNEGVIHEYQLNQNYPNPFNPTTTIGFQLIQSGNVDLGIFNTLGERIATLAAGYRNAGYHEVEWNATNYAGGVYFYRLATDGGFSETHKMILLK